jgi:hypothetical protein
MAPWLHLMLPICRLMQKGPCERHLAAEACTTTDQPTRECFLFLLGPLHVYIYIYKKTEAQQGCLT